ncbi:pseudouridine-5-phosphate glycosidase, partial [Acinetobacter baumannii]|nr:pseudouridine-5-phosphate glycosidase [Acinetobacter baumannii]
GELAARAGRELATDADIAAACAELQGDGVQDVIVTRGAHGVMFTAADGMRTIEAQPNADIVDVTGAGDAFAAAVCWTLYNG